MTMFWSSLNFSGISSTNVSHQNHRKMLGTRLVSRCFQWLGKKSPSLSPYRAESAQFSFQNHYRNLNIRENSEIIINCTK
ncbi:hypothetical protein BpHYR1_015908 [Brachionus plicatilis]|uniref:Uncharacterized protein n=1 Tax=Brachionus plicatilis TaxID=10195 RepID=A0A3M7RTZ3_BRAPC|nr:hypothetical protein BpHYR1_015908 [Brachionus plicatilis]